MNLLLILLVGFLVTHVVMRSSLARDNFDVSHRSNIQNRQAVKVSRLGGIGVLSAAFASLCILRGENQFLMGSVLLSAIPIVAGGFLDDHTQKVSARLRLILGLVSGALFLWITGYVVQDISMPIVSLAFSNYVFAFAVSALALAGVGHGMNIIDGFNGLASGSATVMFVMLGLLAYRVDDPQLMEIAFVHTAVAFGFFLVNFPSGKILLGDGGVYYLGFALAAVVIMLIVRNPTLSPWTATVVIFYPIIEALFSIMRKAWTKGHNPFVPDDIHLHHLVYRLLIANRFSLFRRRTANPLTGLALILYTIFCGTIAHLGFSNTLLAILLSILVNLAYLSTYGLLTFLTLSDDN